MIKDLIPPTPVPVAKHDIDLTRDFCATLVDPKIHSRETEITKLLFKYEQDEPAKTSEDGSN